MTSSRSGIGSLLLLTSFIPFASLRAQQTRPERTAGAETSTYADVTGFLDSLARTGASLRIGTVGFSPEGRRIPWILAARPMVDGPADAQRSGKPIIYVQGNIHAGEVEGKEAAQRLLRELTVGSLRSLLDSVIVLVVPIYNIDGNEQFASGDRNRPGQNGPSSVGRGTNGQGLNLNRDYVKLEAPETRASLALISAWEPDLFIDLHTTNGSYYGYVLTWAPGLNPNSSPANDYARDHFLPTIRERMRRRHRLETFPYGNFRNQEPDSLVLGWETYDARPRFGTNSMGVRGRIPILSEGYSNNPFADRIEATYQFLREILSLAAEEHVVVKRVVLASATWRPDSISLRSRFAPASRQEVIAEITEADGDGSHGFSRRKRTGVFRRVRMPVVDRFEPALQVGRPAAYLLPPAQAGLVTLLRAQGIVASRLTADWTGPGEGFLVDSIQVVPFLSRGTAPSPWRDSGPPGRSAPPQAGTTSPLTSDRACWPPACSNPPARTALRRGTCWIGIFGSASRHPCSESPVRSPRHSSSSSRPRRRGTLRRGLGYQPGHRNGTCPST